MGLLGALVSPVTAHAGPIQFSLQGGTSVPTGDFGDQEQANAIAGWMVTASAEYVVGDLWAFGVDGSYSGNTHGGVGETIDFGGGDTYTLDADNFSTWQAGVHGKVLIASSSPLKPYALVGVGMSSTKEHWTETITSGGVPSTNSGEAATGTHFAGKAGAGMTWWASQAWGLCAEIDYNYLDQGHDDSITYVGIRGGFSVQLGGSSIGN
jgi:opacity protein-like surface antigen